MCFDCSGKFYSDTGHFHPINELSIISLQPKAYMLDSVPADFSMSVLRMLMIDPSVRMDLYSLQVSSLSSHRI
jgi:hypothetical protein